MSDARTDWMERIHAASDDAGAASARLSGSTLPAPAGLRAISGAGHVTLDWLPVGGAVGYLVERSDDGGAFAVVDHHGDDVLAQPAPPYTDTTAAPGRSAYRVRAVAAVDAPGEPSAPVAAGPTAAQDGIPTVTIRVGAAGTGAPMQRPWEPMIGSERLSNLLSTATTGGRPVGDELGAALGRMRDEIGVRRVRAHAVFSADTHVYREVDGEPVHDFTIVDAVYDRVLELGLEPVVEIGFMPRDLAADPSATVFTYGAIVSPPKDFGRWADLVEALVTHLLERYGDRVLGWDFEVWNEANLDVFWSADRGAWFRLYDVTAAAVRRAHPALSVGGPASAAAGWIDAFLEHASASGAPVDFVSTHTYGSPPLDLRAALARHGFGGTRILWTEWGVTPTHFAPVNDSVLAAVFLLAGMRSAAGRVEALSYWVASDHFEELGTPPALIHGGFGLLSVGNLPKPRFHALAMLARLGRTELPVAIGGDGAGGLVSAWAARDAAGRDTDGRIAVLAWNWTLDQSKADVRGVPAAGAAVLERRVVLEVDGLPDGPAEVVVSRLAAGEGDLAAAAAAHGITGWPADDETWSALAGAAALPSSTRRIEVRNGRCVLEEPMPMPSAVLAEILPLLGRSLRNEGRA